MTTQLTVTTANICGNPLRPRWAVRRRMRQALAQPGAVFGQEVAPTNRWPGRDTYAALWRVVSARHDKDVVGTRHEVPISLPASWPHTYRVYWVHGGLARVSPARFITVAYVLVDGLRVALVNTHTVSKPRRGVPAAAWRMARWAEHHAQLELITAQLVDEGHTVIVGGDLNRRDVPPIHPAQRTLTSSGLDHLWIVPASGVRIVGVHQRKLTRTLLMDHPILTATLELQVVMPTS